MIITQDSHLDHELTAAQVKHIKLTFAERDAFFIETIELPERLGTVPCNLHGPAVGEEPVTDDEAFTEFRAKRTWASRMCKRPAVESRMVTVIAGPHQGKPCVLYTAYGGPLAPREPGDPDLPDAEREESEAFWAEHALGRGEP